MELSRLSGSTVIHDAMVDVAATRERSRRWRLRRLSVVLALVGSLTLSYRGDTIFRAKPKNRDKIVAYHEKGKLELILESNLAEVTDSVAIHSSSSRISMLGLSRCSRCTSGQ